jgi:hypothetical protein
VAGVNVYNGTMKMEPRRGLVLNSFDILNRLYLAFQKSVWRNNVLLLLKPSIFVFD